MLEKLMVPISKLYKFKPGISKDEVEEVFKRTDFDIIPINDNPITSYYYKKTLTKEKIDFENTIDINMSIKSLLKKLDSKENIFITENGVIVGLITIADLNSKEFSLWLYKYFIDIEKELCAFIQKNIEDQNEYDETVIRYLKKKKDNSYERYLSDLSKKVNNDPIEYLYFCDLFNIVRDNYLFEKLGCSSKKSFEKYNSLNDLRNCIMHATRSMVRDVADVNTLYGRIEKMEEIQFYLKSNSTNI